MSVFLLDAGREWRDGQRQVLEVARELGRKGLKAHLLAEPDSEILGRAAAEGLSTLPVRMRGRRGWFVRRNLAAVLLRQGEYGQAAFHLREVLRSRPDDREAGINLGIALAGVTTDARVAEAIELVEAKRDGSGRWLLENPHPGTMPVDLGEAAGQPSRWNTLRALRVLDWYSA